MKKFVYTVSVFCLMGAFSQASYANGQIVKGHIKTQLIPAIEAKETSWNLGFKDASDATSNMLESMAALEDVRAQEVEIVKQATVENPPDMDGSLNRKAAEASMWGGTNKQVEAFNGLLDDVASERLSSDDGSLASVDSLIERTAGLLATEGTESDDEIKAKLINTATLYHPKTYTNGLTEEEEAALPADTLESELLDALDFAQFVINPYNPDSAKSDKVLGGNMGNNAMVDSLSRDARKSLAYSAMNMPISMRTNVKDGGLGQFVKSFYEELKEKSDEQWVASIIEDLPADMSKYEFMDHLFHNILMNPAWHISLEEATPKSLKRQKVEMTAFLNMLNWETAKLMEKLVAISAADLATNVDSIQ